VDLRWGMATKNEIRNFHSRPPLNPSLPAVMWKSGVESDGMSSENDSREVFTVYEALNSACSFERFGCLARPDDEADKGSRASGISS